MAGGTWLLIGTGALLVFWAVGAHNRLSTVRDKLVRRHAEVDRVLRLRRKAVIAWVAAVGDAEGADLALHESVLHACAQADAAAGAASRSPTARRAITAANMAEQVLERTMRSFMAHPASRARPAAAQRQAAWVACEVQLAVARQGFNREVAAYNTAVSQFPASLLAAASGLRTTSPIEAGPELSAATPGMADGRDASAAEGRAAVVPAIADADVTGPAPAVAGSPAEAEPLVATAAPADPSSADLPAWPAVPADVLAAQSPLPALSAAPIAAAMTEPATLTSGADRPPAPFPAPTP